ncbi:ATP-binding cassette domain-containing protein [Paenibacillus sp. LHD-117]|uniref:ATP-binding cassette domain-containing protein n=1 Tax=Paenibacillus sp. LHD-117 TaxID=3071412 RepID=UPI0027DFC563|nr:ATP-binding cassette domain-containing protein [Paenibacillus sp. LHD-117]MDQ6422384.1 ATP-binding cassette domain-containing protein [Paenibacillus sp. LHD-117]
MIECEGLVKIFKSDDVEVVALQGLNLKVEAGEMIAIIGNSGSGKSTLLNVLGGLDRPSAGKATIGDWDLLQMDEKERVAYKQHTVGFIWQNNSRNLLPYLTVLENVETAMMVAGKVDTAYAKQLIDWVGLSHRIGNKLVQLSGGEQQRTAIAISLANRPSLLLADEPTGSVDAQTADIIMGIFRKLNQETGVTIVIVTHDMQLAGKVDRVVAIRDGMTSSELLKRADSDDSLDTRTDSFGEHEEYAVVDRFGRLQIPAEYRESLGITDKVKLIVDGTGLRLEPPSSER